jgi:hypothetical protein
MRDFKFRAWDIKNKSFKYFDLTTCLPIYGNKEEFVIQQYTGIEDCSGLYIYEGDILKIGAVTGEVKYVESGYQVEGWDLSFANYLLAKNMVVLGNIFEHGA